jgi:hypothetical protein
MSCDDGIGSGSFLMINDNVEPSCPAATELIKMDIVVPWVMTPCTLVNGCLHFVEENVSIFNVEVFTRGRLL